jgi:hypothetical protein
VDFESFSQMARILGPFFAKAGLKEHTSTENTKEAINRIDALFI